MVQEGLGVSEIVRSVGLDHSEQSRRVAGCEGGKNQIIKNLIDTGRNVIFFSAE